MGISILILIVFLIGMYYVITGLFAAKKRVSKQDDALSRHAEAEDNLTQQDIEDGIDVIEAQIRKDNDE